MFKITVTPQFRDIDGLRHVNNNAVADWFEIGRNSIFRMFTPDLDLRYENWELILVRTETDYISQMFFNYDVEIKTYILHVGNSSFIIGHEAWQEGELKAKGKCVLVNFDFINQKKKTIRDEVRTQLLKHLIDEADIGKDI